MRAQLNYCCILLLLPLAPWTDILDLRALGERYEQNRRPFDVACAHIDTGIHGRRVRHRALAVLSDFETGGPPEISSVEYFSAVLGPRSIVSFFGGSHGSPQISM
jgi:hypothetical protein